MSYNIFCMPERREKLFLKKWQHNPSGSHKKEWAFLGTAENVHTTCKEFQLFPSLVFCFAYNDLFHNRCSLKAFCNVSLFSEKKGEKIGRKRSHRQCRMIYYKNCTLSCVRYTIHSAVGKIRYMAYGSLITSQGSHIHSHTQQINILTSCCSQWDYIPQMAEKTLQAVISNKKRRNGNLSVLHPLIPTGPLHFIWQ